MSTVPKILRVVLSPREFIFLNMGGPKRMRVVKSDFNGWESVDDGWYKFTDGNLYFSSISCNVYYCADDMLIPLPDLDPGCGNGIVGANENLRIELGCVNLDVLFPASSLDSKCPFCPSNKSDRIDTGTDYNTLYEVRQCKGCNKTWVSTIRDIFSGGDL